jgi:hypothetical protein
MASAMRYSAIAKSSQPLVKSSKPNLHTSKSPVTP